MKDIQEIGEKTITVKMMSKEEARACANQIRRTIESARDQIKDLVLELHDRRGWEALGYLSWEECVREEFDVSRRSLNRQLEAKRVAIDMKAQLSDGTKCPSLGDAKLIDEDESDEFDVDPDSIPDAQLRVLGTLPSQDRLDAYIESIKESPKGKPTTAKVQEVVNRRRGKTFLNGNVVEGNEAERLRQDSGAPDDVDLHVDDPGQDATRVEDIVEDMEERAAIEGEKSDEEWLETLPLAQSGALSDFAYRIFCRDALFYRRVEPFLKEFQKAVRPLHKEHMKGTRLEGGYAYLTMLHFRRQHPKDWHRCPTSEHGGCDGTGTFGTIGQCSKCHGRGYLLQ